jgi:Flp pilus assembly protein TadD
MKAKREDLNTARHKKGASTVPAPLPQQRRVPVLPASLAAAIFSSRALPISVALIVVNLAIYFPVHQFDFVYDDFFYIRDNARISSGLTWPNISWAFTTGYGANWFPLTWLSHFLDGQLFGMNSGAHHIANVILHSATSVLLFGLFHWLTGAMGRSAFMAGLFAAHPLRVESVAWVSERKDVLSALFLILTLWAYARYCRNPQRGRYALTLLLFAMGLMAKPMLVTLPFLLLLLDYWPLRRITIGPRSNQPTAGMDAADRPVSVARAVWEKVPFFALTVISSFITFVVQRGGGAVGSINTFPLPLRVANAFVTYLAYLGKTLWPANLAAYYSYNWSASVGAAVVCLVILIAVSVIALKLIGRLPYLLVGWLWYLGTLVPVIGLVQVGNQAMADRYTYIPLIGIFMLAAWGVHDLLDKRLGSRFLMAAAILLLFTLTVVAHKQARHWKNEEDLWKHALTVTSGNYIAHSNLASVLGKQGRTSEALAQYAESLRIRPTYVAYNGMGVALAGLGRNDEAVVQYQEALRLKPDYAEGRKNLGVSLAIQGKVDEATREFAAAIRLEPGDAKLRNDFGTILARQGRFEEAVKEFSEALRLKPDLGEARSNLDLALKQLNRPPSPQP